MSDELSLEGVKEGFSNGVVPAISFAAHTLNAAMSSQFRSEIMAGKLNSPVTVDQKAVRRTSPGKSLAKSPNDRLPFERITQIPSNHDSRKQIYENRKVMPFPANLEIGDICDPSGVGEGHRKLPIEPMGAIGSACFESVVTTNRRDI